MKVLKIYQRYKRRDIVIKLDLEKAYDYND